MKNFRQKILSFVLIFTVLFANISFPRETYANVVDNLLTVVNNSLSVKQNDMDITNEQTIKKDKTISFSIDFNLPTVHSPNLEGNYVRHLDTAHITLAEGVKLQSNSQVGIFSTDNQKIGTGTLSVSPDNKLLLDVIFDGDEIVFEAGVDLKIGLTLDNILPEKDTIKIWDKTYTVETNPNPNPDTQINTEKTVTIKKEGLVDKEHEVIKWTITVNSKSGDLSGYKVYDDLENVSDYVDNSFTVNGINQTPVYNNKILEYTFPNGTTGEQKIEFKTIYRKNNEQESIKTKDIVNKAIIYKDNIEQNQSSFTISKTNPTARMIDKRAIFANDHEAIINGNSSIKDIVNKYNTIQADEHQNKEKYFNHSTKSVIYRLGINASEQTISGKVTLEDVLPEGWEFVEIKYGQKYIILDAERYRRDKDNYGNPQNQDKEEKVDATSDITTLSSSDYTVDFSGNKAKFTFINGLTKSYVILLKARPTDATLRQYVDYYHDNINQEKNYYPSPDNNATIFWGDDNSSRDNQEVIIRPKMMTKSFEFVKDENSDKSSSIKWSLDYRPYGDIPDDVKITDTLGQGIEPRLENGNLIFVDGDFNIYEIELSPEPMVKFDKDIVPEIYDNGASKVDSGKTYTLYKNGVYVPNRVNYGDNNIVLNSDKSVSQRTKLNLDEIKQYISYDSNSRTFTFNIPDKNKAYRFEYVTDITDLSDDITNNAKLNGYDNIYSNVTIPKASVQFRGHIKILPYVKVIKTDIKDNSPIDDVKFEITKDNANSDNFQTITTDSSGIARSKYLPIGKYKLKEITPDNYKENVDIYTIEVKKTADDKDIEYIVTDKGGTELLSGKTSEIGKRYINFDITNEKILVHIKILKTDENGNPIIANADNSKNAEFKLTLEDNTELTAYNNENGIVSFNDIPVGTHKLIESKSPEGYNSNTTAYTLKVSKDDADKSKIKIILSDENNAIVWENIIDTTENINAKEYLFSIKNYKTPPPSDATHNLQIAKRVEGSGINSEDEFTFRLELDGENGKTYEYDKYDTLNNVISSNQTISSGDSFTLKGGQHINIKNLPDGVRYVVTETDYKYYTPKATIINGMLSTEPSLHTTNVVLFVNSKELPKAPPTPEEPKPPTTPDEEPPPEEPPVVPPPQTPPAPEVPKPDVPTPDVPVPEVPVPEAPPEVENSNPNPPTDTEEPPIEIEEPPTPTIPRYPRNDLPDPYDPESPDEIIVVDEDGVPLGTYIKTVTPDGTIEYILKDEEIPLGSSLPKTGQDNNMYYILGMSLVLISFRLRKRK